MNTKNLTVDSKRIQRVREVATSLTEQRQFNSIEWCITHQRKVVEQGAVGKADLANDIDLPDNPIYRIYSMTKPIVSVAALRLIENGELILSAPVTSYLPEFTSVGVIQADGSVATDRSSTSWQPMTVEHLLTHRSGLSYDFLPDCEVAELYRQNNLVDRGDLSLRAFVEELAKFPLAYQPGTEWQYSYSIDVLARIIEVVRKQPLAEALNDLIFSPCGMLETGFRLSPEQQTRLIPSFGQQSLDVARPLPQGPHQLNAMNVDQGHPLDSDKFARGGHGLYSTTNDYLKFMHVLYDGCAPDGTIILSAPMADMMWNDRIPASQKPLQICGDVMGGYGWNLFGRVMVNTGESDFLTAVGEGGWSGAAATYFWVDRNTGLGGLVMTQYLGSTAPLGPLIKSAAYQALI